MTARAVTTAALAALLATSAPAFATPDRLSVGVFAPAAFDDSDAARAHAEALARAIEAGTGVATSARVYFRWADLTRAAPDLAIVSAACVAVHRPGRVVAAATGPTPGWSVYAGARGRLASLAGKRLAHVRAECRDDDVIDHALLWSELPAGFFGPRIGRPTVAAAITAVETGAAAAAILPRARVGDRLVEVFRAADLPGPALVVTGRDLDAELVGRVARAVTGARDLPGGLRWTSADTARFEALARRLQRQPKPFVLAPPPRYRLSVRGVVDLPAHRAPLPSLRHHLGADAGRTTE